MLVLLAIAAFSAADGGWVHGEIGFRLNNVPEGSVAQRAGLKIGDILIEPPRVAARLRESSPHLPVFRVDMPSGEYKLQDVPISIPDGAERRLGVVGDLGFLVLKTERLAQRAEIRTGDFLPKIDDQFVHAVEDLALVRKAAEASKPVEIHFIRWDPVKKEFLQAASRPKF